MTRVWCPVCDQGWVVAATVERTGQRVWVCEECEVLWLGQGPPEGDVDDTLSTYLLGLGRRPIWSELTVVDDAQEA